MAVVLVAVMITPLISMPEKSPPEQPPPAPPAESAPVEVVSLPPEAQQQKPAVPSDMVSIGAPKDAGWVLRLPDLTRARTMLAQKPLQQLLNEPRFPFSTAALNSACFASKFDPVSALDGLAGIFEGPVTVVGMRRLNRWQGYAYARVRQSAWGLWKRKMLQDPESGWREAGEQMCMRPLSLSLATGHIDDPLLVYSNGSVVCIAIGEQAMDEFISIWKNPALALQVKKAEADARTIQFYMSAEAAAPARSVLYDSFLPAMVQRHPVLRDPTVASPEASIEGSVTFTSSETVFDLNFRPTSPAPAGALSLKNAEILTIPKGVPEDAINFFRIEANLGEVMMDVIAKNREDRSFAERTYTRFYTSRQYFPMEKLPALMGENAYRFQIPGSRSGRGLATVWVWSSEDGPAMAESLGAVLMAESSGSMKVDVKRQGQLSLFEIPLEGEIWYMLGIDKRVFFTNEVEALMARSRVDPLVDTMQIPEQLLQDQAMIFYRNQNRLPKLLNKRPLDLSSFPSIWWYIARVYPFQFGLIEKGEEGTYEAKTWLRF